MTAGEARDDELMQALAEAMSGVGGPPTARELASASSARDRVGAIDPWDIAELVSDSLFDHPLEVRGSTLASGRQLVFYADDITISLDVGADLLACHINGAEPVAVSVVTATDNRYPMLELGGGEYELADPPVGTVRLVIQSPAGRVATDWFRL